MFNFSIRYKFVKHLCWKIRRRKTQFEKILTIIFVWIYLSKINWNRIKTFKKIQIVVFNTSRQNTSIICKRERFFTNEILMRRFFTWKAMKKSFSKKWIHFVSEQNAHIDRNKILIHWIENREFCMINKTNPSHDRNRYCHIANYHLHWLFDHYQYCQAN